MPRLFAIGDIHGCASALEALIKQMSPKQDDIVVTLGDYVDRGPDSKGVIDQLIRLAKQTQMVGILGNHEEMMMDVISGSMSHQNWLRYGGVDTLESYGFDGNLDFLPPDHDEFLHALGDYFEHGDFFFTHGCYDAETPLIHQDPRVLRWQSLRDGVPQPHVSGKTAVVGHTANHQGEIVDFGHLICLDTCCYGGGWLTAMEMNSRQVFQTNQDGEVRRN